MPEHNQSKPDNLKSDFETFVKKLDELPESLQTPQNRSYAERLKMNLSLEKLRADSTKVNEFYEIFADFTEGTNTFKMLYQVLLEEYFRLGIFDSGERDELKESAKQKIEKLLRAGKWHGSKNLKNRAGFRNEMLAEIRLKAHEKAAVRAKKGRRIATICLSGGGIRSATFGLGVLQGLAKHKLLRQFDYISTVSGGGYIGSWFSAWIHRTGVSNDEFTDDGVRFVEGKMTAQTADQPEPPEITHLRSYSNYMSPRTGLFSADTWTLIAVYLRNLLLNWTVFVPLIAAFLLLPKMFVTVIGSNYSSAMQTLVLTLGIVSGLVAVININAMRPTLKEISWVKQSYRENEIGIWSSVEGKVFRWVLAWILASAFLMITYWAWSGGAAHFSISQTIAGYFEKSDKRLIDYIILSEIFFLGGYLLVRLVFWLRKFLGLTKETILEAQKPVRKIVAEGFWAKLKYFYGKYLSELLTSILCGLLSGALLYLTVDNLGKINIWAYGIFGKPLNEADAVTPKFLACFGVPLYLLVFLLAATLFVGFSVRFTNDEDREWMARFGAWLLMFIVGWSIVSSAVIFGSQIFTLDWKGGLLASIGGVSGLVTLVLGFSGKSTVTEGNETKSKKSFLIWFAPAVAAPVFVLFLIILIAYGTQILIGKADLFSEYSNLKWFIVLAAVGSLMGLFININKFSFHSIYRERLIRAYLGASRTKKRLFTANSFTGLDSEHDNLEMRDLKQKPLHVVNMTLNLVKTQNLRWQNRKAESFTMTALHCGSSNMGEGSGNYRSSEDYAVSSQTGRAITLGTAAAISGAAASPNMGYYTMSSAVSFLMVLFNVRLGWWLGNPGRRGKDTYTLPAPRWSPRLFLDESIGGTDDSKPYVYLSDGGHFENLGLYEMVLRRCSLIVVSDAGCDADFGFSDFGTAIHKIRVDMGIPIEFEKDRHPAKTRNCGIGKIKYSCVDGADAKDGVLIYLKPTLDGDEPIDLKNYKKENPDFPHESTGDQMYSETQFESYRSLGFHQINSICCRQTDCICENLSDLEANAEKYLDDLADK